jgi:hypothetical protein
MLQHSAPAPSSPALLGLITDTVACCCLLRLLQAWQLAQSPFHCHFMRQLIQLAEFVNVLTTAHLRSALRECLPPEFTTALQHRLLVLNGHISRAHCTIDSWEELPEPTDELQATGSIESARTPLITPNQLCNLLGQVVELLAAPVSLHPCEEQLAGEGSACSLEQIEQLLSVPDALLAVLQLGLSEAVQEAAAEGDPVAASCVGCVCRMFRNIAFTLRVKDLNQVLMGSNAQVEEAATQLRTFLRREETLPFLEPLCLPPDHSEPQIRALLKPAAAQSH